MELINQRKIISILDWAYLKSVNGVTGLASAEDLAKNYIKASNTPFQQSNALIRQQNTTAATLGFITGLGGGITLPVTIPASIASALCIQMRMTAAIAHLGGYDLKDERVKHLIYACLVADSAQDVLNDVGVTIGNKVAMNAVKSISTQALQEIHNKFKFNLLHQVGGNGISHFGKFVPVLGGLVSGVLDAHSTNSIGNVARDTFTPQITQLSTKD